MRVALCQLNPKVGAFDLNLNQILKFVKKSGENNCDIVVFPELSLSGYPPLDLLDRAEFQRIHQFYLDSFQKKIQNISEPLPRYIVLGAFTSNQTGQGKSLHNSALIYVDKKLQYVQCKRLLPTYDVFDEARYFEPGTESRLLETPFGKLAFTICEDIWFDPKKYPTANQNFYSQFAGADWIFNLSASPFEKDKEKIRTEALKKFVQATASPLFYVNQVGANDELIFDGSSRFIDSSGSCLVLAKSFCEDLLVIDTDKFQKNENLLYEKKLMRNDSSDTIKSIYQALVLGIKDYFIKTGFKKAVLGLSGGIDSAVVACLAVDALGAENLIGVALPGPYSSTHSLEDAQKLAEKLKISFFVHSIQDAFSVALQELSSSFENIDFDLTEENMQSRMRGLFLMALANKKKALVLCTSNKSEAAVGYGTLYGDMIGAMAPLGDLFKTQVYELAHYINTAQGLIPESSMTKPPSAELRPNQKDQDTLPEYSVLDSILASHLEKGLGRDDLITMGYNLSLVDQILSMVQQSEFKRRQAPLVLKISSKAFGLGRRHPVVHSLPIK